MSQPVLVEDPATLDVSIATYAPMSRRT